MFPHEIVIVDSLIHEGTQSWTLELHVNRSQQLEVKICVYSFNSHAVMLSLSLLCQSRLTTSRPGIFCNSSCVWRHMMLTIRIYGVSLVDI